MSVLNKAAARVQGAVEQVAGVAAPAAQWLEDQGEALSSRGERLMDGTCNYVAARPLRSLGVLLAAGYLIGLLTGSSARPQR